jgi:pre-mRNA-processing factor 40
VTDAVRAAAVVALLLQSLDRLTRLEVFQEFIRGLEEAERQEKEKEKELRRRQERRNRDSFRQLLQQHRCVLRVILRK